jgi:hypothetical protein
LRERINEELKDLDQMALQIDYNTLQPAEVQRLNNNENELIIQKDIAILYRQGEGGESIATPSMGTTHH